MAAVLRSAPPGENLVSPVSCLPWWHNQFIDPSFQTVVESGVRPDSEGHIPADPERLRAAAEQFLIKRGIWRGHLPLAAYTLGRYAQAEVGSGTPEEKMAVIQAAIRQARRSYPQLSVEDGVNRLLLRRTCRNTQTHPLAESACGRYGRIHAPDSVCARLGRPTGCHPYGRWAATSKDPTIQTILIAAFALAGKPGDFARGADDQMGPDAARAILRATDATLAAGIRARATRHHYWIGPLAGVNPRHTLLYAHRPDITGTPVAQALVNAAIQAVTSPKPAVPTVVCPRPGAERPLVAAITRPRIAAASVAGVALFLALSAGVGLWASLRAEGRQWR